MHYAKLRSEGCNLRDQKTKLEITKDLENSIANGKKNESTDIQQMAENYTANEEDVAEVV